MSKKNFKFNYKEIQIIKHSLQGYIERPQATHKETEEELRLLNKVENEVELMKEEYGIK